MKKCSDKIRYIEIGSAFMKTEHKHKLMQLFPKARICMHYGLTEASRASFIEFHNDKQYLHTAGMPSPNVEIQIWDKSNKNLPKNTVGEIVVKGDFVMCGYWNKPELTNNSILNSWLKTGDVGKIDNNGFIHLLGRTNDIINIGGLKIAPGEIEEVLLNYEGICEACVIGIPSNDHLSRDVVKAFIVTDNIDIDIEKIIGYCMDQMESYKVPQTIEIVNSIPKTSSGKIQRHILRKKESQKD